MTMHVTEQAFADLVVPPEVEAMALVGSVEHAIAALSDAVHHPAIRAALTGLDAGALEKCMERIAIIVEEIDRGQA